MTREQLDEILQTHWELLWPLPAAERTRRFAEIRADLEYTVVLDAVADEMAVLG